MRWKITLELNKRHLLWFSPLLAVPVIWLQSPPPNQQTPPQTQKPNFIASPAAFSSLPKLKLEQSPSLVTSGKPEPSKSALQKPQQLPKKAAATKSSPKTKAKPRPYIAPAIEIRVALAQNVNQLVIASSTKANITDVNGRRVEQLPPGQAFQAVANNSTVASNNWQTPSAMWIEPTGGGAIFVGDRWYRGKLLVVAQGDKLVAIC